MSIRKACLKKRLLKFGKFRKYVLEHSTGYDVIKLLSKHKLLSFVEDNRHIIISRYGRNVDELLSLLDSDSTHHIPDTESVESVSSA